MTDRAVTAVVPTTSAPSRRYRFGWVVACTFLASAADPTIPMHLSASLGTGGLVVGGLYTLWKLVIGVAATTVRPWGWSVLLASQPLLLVWAVVYTIAFGSGRTDVVIIFVLAVVTAVLGFAYYYKRRTMFGATWRWRGLERWLPGWAGPESIDPDVRHGFAGLSPVGRRAFIAATVIMTALVVFGK
jgi:hypothetical protein